MTEEKKRGADISIGVALSFIFLFLIFLLLKNPKTTGLATYATGAVTTSSGPSSKIIIVVITLVLILAFGLSLFFFMRMKHKKKSLSEKEAINLSEEQIEKLFSEEQVSAEKPKTIIEISSEKIKEETPIEKVIPDSSELKREIRSLINKGVGGQEILNKLIKRYTKEQIEKAVDEVNYENLRLYIQKTLNEGFNKDRIKKALLFKNWPESQINKVFNEVERLPQPLKSSKPIEKTEEKEKEELDLDLI